MASGRNPSGLPNIGSTLVSARSFDEYVAMFALSDDDLSGAILDCPGGAASFTAEARAVGLAVTAIDPVYVLGSEQLATHAVEEAVRGNRHTASSVESFVWTYFRDVADHLTRRKAAALRFGEDLVANPSAYVAGSLPHLPFHDSAFDLVLSSHLLFMYADRLDERFHIAAAREMARVARREVRIFPLISDSGKDTTTIIDAVRRGLSSAGYSSSIEPSPYEFQRGGHEMLIVKLG